MPTGRHSLNVKKTSLKRLEIPLVCFDNKGEYINSSLKQHPNGQIAEKATTWHCILSAELTKNALFQTVFLAILPTGIYLYYIDNPYEIIRSNKLLHDVIDHYTDCMDLII